MFIPYCSLTVLADFFLGNYVNYMLNIIVFRHIHFINISLRCPRCISLTKSIVFFFFGTTYQILFTTYFFHIIFWCPLCIFFITSIAGFFLDNCISYFPNIIVLPHIFLFFSVSTLYIFPFKITRFPSEQLC